MSASSGAAHKLSEAAHKLFFYNYSIPKGFEADGIEQFSSLPLVVFKSHGTFFHCFKVLIYVYSFKIHLHLINGHVAFEIRRRQ